MELSTAIRRRRMVRRYDPSRPVPHEVLVTCLDAATRAPSAGFTQGWDFVVLTSDAQRQAFWGATRESEHTDTWLAGLMTAPTLILCASDPNAYLDRYTEADKSWTDRDPDRWPIPYWDVDTGMAAMLMLLTAVDQGIGGCFFGVPTGRHTPVRAALGIPEDRRLVGVISLGYAVPHPKSPSLRRGRRTVEDVAHWGRFGGSPAPTDAAVGED